MSSRQNAAWHGSASSPQHPPPSPPMMSANADGPVDPHEFYTSFSSTSSAATSSPVRLHLLHENVQSFRSFSQSPERARFRPPSIPPNTTSNQKLSNARSQPVLGSRQPAAVRQATSDLSPINDEQPLGTRMPNEKYRRNLVHKTPPPQAKRSKAHAQKSTPTTSFESVNDSFASSGTVASAQSRGSYVGNAPAVRVQQPAEKSRPLFGEINTDGTWNGQFDLHAYAAHHDRLALNRRSSDGNIALPYQRPLSQNETLHPGFPHPESGTKHNRSRSDMTAMRSQDTPALSQLVIQTLPFIQQASPSAQQPTPRPPAQPLQPLQPVQPASRIPIRGRKHSSSSQQSSGQPSRPASAAAVRQPVTGPPHVQSTAASGNGNENEKPQTKRYIPPKLPQVTQLLSAKVVTPPPKVSPPLRSSRPRQPVSSATTAASRARAASTQHQPSPDPPAARAKPSEQWLGKPYDPKQEKSRRKIHEIGKIDFAERRARIQKAMSRNLEESASVEQLQAQLAAEADTSKSPLVQSTAGAERGVNIVDQHQADILDTESATLGLTRTRSSEPKSNALVLDTANLPAPSATGDSHLNTADTEVTEFEIGESLDAADGTEQSHVGSQHQHDDNVLLSATTYVPRAKQKLSQAPSHSVLDSKTTQDVSAESSPSDIEDRWGLKRGVDNTGSIRIMLDDNPSLLRLQQDRTQHDKPSETTDTHNNSKAVAARPSKESKVVPHAFQNTHKSKSTNDAVSVDPHHTRHFDDLQEPASRSGSSGTPIVTQAIDQYRSTGQVAPELLYNLDRHSLDLDQLSANGGSDAAVVKSLLRSIAAQGLHKPQMPDAMPVTPHTPPGTFDIGGTAVVYDHRSTLEATPDRRSDDAVLGSDDEDDFALQIRRADEAWERQLRGEGPMFPDEEPFRPALPPKDDAYTPHSSIGPDNSSLENRWREASLRDSFDDNTRTSISKNVDSVISEEAVIPARTLTPSLPQHAPPPPPVEMQESRGRVSADNDRSSVQSPRINDLASGSERPSVDSEPRSQAHPASMSASSLAGSANAVVDQAGRQAVSPSPEHKRLTKRKNTIRELLDTENTYHQDLKIIEDIYKATVADVVSPEDRKTLFGNCDEIEKFSLSFYDQLRKAAAPIYTPSKGSRWANQRGSSSTAQSDGQASTTNVDALDDGRDKATYIGKVFLENLLQMEHLYGAYLRNHDAANQRLSILQANPTIKFWLDECHNNASDITSAWDLDSLLVKPTQRVSKYPLILQQLLESTPTDHPDHESLKSAARDTVAMLTRINEAKKRADIVEQMISGKRKDTDVRSGLAKAFGRRTERLKERVGINEAFQDPEFDALAQAFGGHYIRLQVTMRDFQDYINQVERAVQSTNNYSSALEFFTDVHQSSMPEIESKWRRYGQIIRELTSISLSSHKLAVQQRVIAPLISLIKIHESPQRAINKRKKHIIDYAKCKSIEKRGEKPDKKTVEASEMYEALNDQLKIELPRLYEMTGKLVMTCLTCFIESQLEWQQAFERKLAPLLDTKDIPKSIQDIIPSFNAEFDFVKPKLTELGICNGSILAESSTLLTSIRTSDGDGGRASMPEGSRPAESDSPAQVASKRHSRTIGSDLPPAIETPTMPAEMRVRTNSTSAAQQGTGMTPVTPIALLTAANRPWSNSVVSPPSSGYPSRPSTATAHNGHHTSFSSSVRSSSDQARDGRHDSTATYVTARDLADHRFSGIFSSALPPSDSQESFSRENVSSPTPMTTASESTPVLFTCASLYEFQIDKTRKEAGYSYHTYETGAIFDCVAQKGELWLAINQDDKMRTLGWIWEQHFVILTDHGTDGLE